MDHLNAQTLKCNAKRAVTYQKEHRLAYFMYWFGTSEQIKAKNSSHLSAAEGEDEKEPQGQMN